MWILRIILKDLKISTGADRILAHYHKDAVELYNSTSSLKEVSYELIDPLFSISNILKLFRPIKPMLAAKKTLDDIKDIVKGKRFTI